MIRKFLSLLAMLLALPVAHASDAADSASAGLHIDKVEPREALPAGGDVVTLVGAGFDKSIEVTIGGKPAAVVEVAANRVKVRVPAGAAGHADIAAKMGSAAFSGTPDFGYAPHPYLLFHASELPKLREKFNNKAFTGYHDIILADAQEQLKGVAGAKGKEAQRAIESLMWGYIYTGDKANKDALLGVLTKPIFNTNPDVNFQFMDAMMIAKVYDALFPDLIPDERVRLEGFLDTHLQCYEKMKNNWFFHNPSNTVAIGYSGAGMAALAMMNSTPAAKKVVDQAYAGCSGYLKTCISPDGGYIEGNLYWDYAITHYLEFAHGYEGAMGNEKGLLDNPQLKSNYRFVETQLGGDRNYFTFCDTQPWLTGQVICADLGARFKQPLMTWISDYMAHNTGNAAEEMITANENAGRSQSALALLWRGDAPPVKEFPGVPSLSFLEKMNWGVMRSDKTFVPGLVVGLKGSGGTLSHHKQNDLGSFVLQARGEAFLIDPGYFQEAAGDHTLPLIDGHGPDVSGSTISNAYEKGSIRSLLIDSTKGYKAARVRRSIVMAADKAVVVLDDLAPTAGQPGKITNQFQCGFKTTIAADKQSATIFGVKSKLVLRVYGSGIELKGQGPRDFQKSWIFKKLADEGKVQWNSVSTDYTADLSNPLVTVLLPVDAKDEAPKTDVQRSGDTIRVTIAGTDPIVFEKKADGWLFAHP